MTWGPLDLSGIIDQVANGIDGRPHPSTLTRDDGLGLLYSGMVNGIHGESGSGKTWLALHASAQQLRAGNRVIYIDHEGDPRSIVARLLDLGLDADTIHRGFLYTQPETAFSEGGSALEDSVRDYSPTLVVIDSTGEGLALHGAKPNADEEVALWFREVPRRIADEGPAVLLLDHSAKASGGELWPIGSQRKRAAINGAQFYVETLNPFARERAGAAKLLCAKDRHGHFTVGQKVATLHVTPDTPLRIKLAAPDPAERAADGGHRPTILMEKVSRSLIACGSMTSMEIEKQVPHRREVVRRAVQVLVDEGYVAREKGERGKLIHTLVKPFSTSPQSRGDLNPENSGDLDWADTPGARSQPRNHAPEHPSRAPRPTSPQVAPGDLLTTSPLAPPLKGGRGGDEVAPEGLPAVAEEVPA